MQGACGQWCCLRCRARRGVTLLGIVLTSAASSSSCLLVAWYGALGPWFVVGVCTATGLDSAGLIFVLLGGGVLYNRAVQAASLRRFCCSCAFTQLIARPGPGPVLIQAGLLIAPAVSITT